MKRAVFLITILLLSILAALSAHGALTFVPVLGSAMEPVLPSGSIAFVQPVTSTDIRPGQIIVFRSPEAARDLYNYPAIAARRVEQIIVSPSLAYVTSGDATGTDPVEVPPGDIIGTAGGHIPWLGYPMLFFQSVQDMILVGIAYVLLVMFCFRNVLWAMFRPAQQREPGETIRVEKQRQPAATEVALDKFATAMADYAKHLASHTTAIKGLSEASQELKRGAAEQNRVLAAMLKQAEGTSPARPAPPGPSFPQQPQRVNAPAEKVTPPPSARRPGPKKRPDRDNERILTALLKNLRDVREASAAAPPIPEVTFAREPERKAKETVMTPAPLPPAPVPPVPSRKPEPKAVPGCARRHPFKGKYHRPA